MIDEKEHVTITLLVSKLVQYCFNPNLDEEIQRSGLHKLSDGTITNLLRVDKNDHESIARFRGATQALMTSHLSITNPINIIVDLAATLENILEHGQLSGNKKFIATWLLAKLSEVFYLYKLEFENEEET